MVDSDIGMTGPGADIGVTGAGADFLLERVNRFSRFGKLLLNSRPHLREELERGGSQPFSAEEMQAALESAGVTDEASLKSALRTLRQRVLLPQNLHPRS